jgi:hypothetical protein
MLPKLPLQLQQCRRAAQHFILTGNAADDQLIAISSRIGFHIKTEALIERTCRAGDALRDQSQNTALHLVNAKIFHFLRFCANALAQFLTYAVFPAQRERNGVFAYSKLAGNISERYCFQFHFLCSCFGIVF